MKNIFRLFGWFFIVLGVIGLVTPFLHGIVLIGFGLAVLSFVSNEAQKTIDAALKLIARRFPTFAKFLATIEEKCKTVLERVWRWRRK